MRVSQKSGYPSKIRYNGIESEFLEMPIMEWFRAELAEKAEDAEKMKK